MAFNLDNTIGIDFGTCFSTVSRFCDNAITLVQDEYQETYIPSFISFCNDKYYAGRRAYLQATTNSINTVYEVKRIVGRKYDDETVQQCKKQWPFALVKSSDGGVRIQVQNGSSTQEFSPEDIIYLIVLYLKERSETVMNHSVTHAVITVPSYYNHNQRKSITMAIAATGLEIISVLTEPTAAALAYASLEGSENERKTRNMLVYDFGGGTFDVSLIQITLGQYEVLATSGDTDIGGRDLTRALESYIIEQMKKFEGLDLYYTTPNGKEATRKWAEQAKCELTVSEKSVIYVQAEEDDYEIEITRSTFEKLIHNIVVRTINVCVNCVENVGMKRNDIECIVLIGGSSFIPYITSKLAEAFPETTIKKTIDTRAAVATGALHYARLLKRGYNLHEDLSKKIELTAPGQFLSMKSVAGFEEEEDVAIYDMDGDEKICLFPPVVPEQLKSSPSMVSFDKAITLITQSMSMIGVDDINMSVGDVLRRSSMSKSTPTASVSAPVNFQQAAAIPENDVYKQAKMKSDKKSELESKASLQRGFTFNFNEQSIFSDVTPLSIGYLDGKKKFYALVPRNTKLPFKKTYKFCTSKQEVTNASLQLAQAEDNNTKLTELGSIRLENIPNPERKSLIIMATISIDANNNLEIQLSEQTSNLKVRKVLESVFTTGDKETQQLRDKNQGYIQHANVEKLKEVAKEIQRKLKKIEEAALADGNADYLKEAKSTRDWLAKIEEYSMDQAKQKLASVTNYLTVNNIPF